MALETVTHISDLVAANPTSTDPKSEGDNHLRNIKTALKTDFPNISGVVTKSHTQLNNTVDKTGDTMTGTLTLPSLNGGQLAGQRNKIINGGCQVAQRGNAAVGLGGVWTYGGADRFASAWFNFSTCTGTLQQYSAGAGTFISRLATGAVVTTTGSGQFKIQQRIESANTIELNGRTITITVYVRHDVGSNINCYIELFKPTTAADTFSAQTLLATGSTVSVADQTRTALTLTYTLAAGESLLGLAPTVVFALGAVTGKNVQAGDWQMEVGSVATPFEHRPYGMELALCRRYYNRQTPTAEDQTLGVGHNTLTTAAVATSTFPVTMRTAPTALEQSGTAGDYSVAHAATNTVCSAVPTFLTSSPFAATTTFTVASGLTAGQGSRARAVNTSAYLAWSAEL